VFYYETVLGTIGIEENGSAITKVFLQREGYQNKNQVKETETTLLQEAGRELLEYLEGKRTIFEVPIQYEGTEFQQRVWKALCEIPYGETRTYGEIAAKINNPKASRAVGNANNKNEIMIIVPCHRVIGSNGKLVGYAGGLDVKEKLLSIEGIIR
jgi:methylated-DNA-[protein]-cysteine S-methyltransferase